jgi:hypothetical protein
MLTHPVHYIDGIQQGKSLKHVPWIVQMRNGTIERTVLIGPPYSQILGLNLNFSFHWTKGVLLQQFWPGCTLIGFFRIFFPKFLRLLFSKCSALGLLGFLLSMKQLEQYRQQKNLANLFWMMIFTQPRSKYLMMYGNSVMQIMYRQSPVIPVGTY